MTHEANTPSQQIEDPIKKNELVETGLMLTEKAGFGPGTSVSAGEMKNLANEIGADLDSALDRVYGTGAMDLTRDPDVRLAYLMNIQKMVEQAKFRKNSGQPYYTHPQSVSRRFLETAPKNFEDRKRGLIGALLHDYLEEGDGANMAVIGEVKAALGGMEPEFAEETALLTEPYYVENGVKERPEFAHAVDYDALKQETGLGRKELETVLFGIMLSESRLMQLVVPADKRDNVGDIDVVQRKKLTKEIADESSDEFKKRFTKLMANKLGTFLFYADNCVDESAQASRDALAAAVHEKIASMKTELPGLEMETQKCAARFKDLQSDPKVTRPLRKQLAGYYGEMGLETIARRFES